MKLFYLNLSLALFIQYCQAGTTFVAKDATLYDANGHEFIIRGINSAHAWWDNYNRNVALNSIPHIAKTGANTVRIAWQIHLNSIEQSHLEKIIQAVINNKMVAVVELHDATCKPEPQILLECAYWFKNNIALFNKYKRYVIINIANEWSPSTNEIWKDTYKAAVNIIRSSGWDGALMIDAHGCGQIPDAIIAYGNELVQSDPSHNLIFSIHMYGLWISHYNIGAKLWDIKTNKRLSVVVGEFAQKLDCKNPPTAVDAWQIMRECQWKNIGYIGWSWHGNSKSDGCSTESDLNMVPGDAQQNWTWNQDSYTYWGNILVYYQGYGLKDTSKRASIFN